MADVAMPSLFQCGNFFYVIRQSGTAKRGHLYYFVLKAYMSEPEPPAHKATIVKEPFYLAGRCICADVEILWSAPQHKVAHAPADEICDKTPGVKAIQDAKGIHAHVL